MKASEDVHGDGMLVAEVALQDVQRLDEVVACVDFVAAGFLKLGEITPIVPVTCGAEKLVPVPTV